MGGLRYDERGGYGGGVWRGRELMAQKINKRTPTLAAVVALDFEPLQKGENPQDIRVTGFGHLQPLGFGAAELSGRGLNAAADLGGDGIFRPRFVIESGFESAVRANQ